MRFFNTAGPVKPDLHFCSSFPESPKLEVPRTNVIDTIEDIFKNDVQVVVVEGEDGIGKTTLLSQFARRHYRITGKNKTCH